MSAATTNDASMHETSRVINRADRKQLIPRSELLELPQSDLMLGYMMSDAEAEMIDARWTDGTAAAAGTEAELEAVRRSPIYQNVAVPCRSARIRKNSLHNSVGPQFSSFRSSSRPLCACFKIQRL